MKSAMGWIIVIVIICAAAGTGLYNFHSANQAHAYALELSDMKREFLTNTTGMFLLDDDQYRKEIGAHFSRYFRQLRKLSKAYPESYDIERQRTIGAEKLAKGRLSESQKQQRDERILVSVRFLRIVSLRVFDEECVVLVKERYCRSQRIVKEGLNRVVGCVPFDQPKVLDDTLCIRIHNKNGLVISIEQNTVGRFRTDGKNGTRSPRVPRRGLPGQSGRCIGELILPGQGEAPSSK